MCEKLRYGIPKRLDGIIQQWKLGIWCKINKEKYDISWPWMWLCYIFTFRCKEIKTLWTCDVYQNYTSHNDMHTLRLHFACVIYAKITRSTWRQVNKLLLESSNQVNMYQNEILSTVWDPVLYSSVVAWMIQVGEHFMNSV